MKKLIICIAAIVTMVACTGSGQKAVEQIKGYNLKVENLSARNKLVRISSDKKYLLLPVEEGAPSWTANIILDTEPAGSFTVPLAVSKIDYWVPFDLEKYQGRELILSFAGAMSRMPRGIQAAEPESEPLCWESLKLSDDFDTTNTELLWRPEYHFTPAYGWMNDPNGMVYKDGEWHLFYQYNPYASVWGNMNWGHAVSRDLVNWEHLPVAIAPDALGTIFSGSAVVDKNNTAGFGAGAIVAIYTNSGVRQMQSIAYSTDNGRTFTKYAGNPVITSDLVDFRDPKVIWNEEIGKWNLVLAAGDAVRFYSSPNLKDWTLESSFGQDRGSHGGVWECPDLFTVPVKGTDIKKWVLVVNNGGGPAGGSATQYFVGDFDGKTFTCPTLKDAVKWMDWGKDHYATVSFSNAPEDRNVVLAWMSNWDYADKVPTVQYRSSNSIPRDLYLYENGEEYYLSVCPSPEMEAARGTCTEKTVGQLNAEGVVFDDLLAQNGGVVELVIDFKIGNEAGFGIELFNSKDETVLFTYDKVQATFSCDRRNSGAVDFHEAFPLVSVAPLADADSYSLRLFIDKSSVEAFDEAGRFSMTNLVFPHEAFAGVRLTAPAGDVDVASLKVFSINE